MPEDVHGYEQARKSWRLRWLHLIALFGNREEQGGLWFGGKPLRFSYHDLAGQYFHELSLSRDLGGFQWVLEQGGITEAEVSAVEEFHELAEAYDESARAKNWEHVQILSDPAWALVVGAAEKASDRLRGLLSDPEEIAAVSIR